MELRRPSEGGKRSCSPSELTLEVPEGQSMYSTADFRKGLRIEYQGEPYIIMDFQHVKPGKGGAFVRTKLKNLITGLVREETFRSGDKVGIPDIHEREMQYLYREGTEHCFMDTETYEQLLLTPDQLGDSQLYLKEQIHVKVLFVKGKPLGVELPNFVALEVLETEPGIRGDTASGGSKPAKLETGAIVQVPLFIVDGDLIKVDTRTGEYIERVGSK